MKNGIVSSIVAVICLLGAGCVTYQEERVSPSRQTTLTVARVGDSISIQFPSEKGVSYTVLYSSNLGSGRWQPLPNGQNLVGTGELIMLEDRVENGTQRYYRLQVNEHPKPASRR